MEEYLGVFETPGAVTPELEGIDQPGVTVTTLSGSTLSMPLGPGDADSAGRFPLADLALLVAGDLLMVRIFGAPPEPIRVRHGDGLQIPLLFQVEDGASVTITQETTASARMNGSTYLDVGVGARVDHAEVSFGGDVSVWSMTQVRLAADAHYQRQQYQQGGRRRRTELSVLLAGRNAQAHVDGAWVVGADTHLDQQLIVEHRAPDTLSRQKFHGIGAGKGTGIFNGRIHIHPGAPGSDAALSNRNLAVHPEATINTKPELEIYTDDVKCAHGATVGQLSADSLFYLRSRGLSEADSRRLLCRAFINECIHGPLAEAAEQTLLAPWSGSGS
jgi:Fe-S cluster assembly scaffold protein SufB